MSPPGTPTPRDFTPYRAQLSGCECPLCRECGYAASRAGGDTRTPATALLAALQAGTHQRVELAERIVELKAERAVSIAAACSGGRSERYVAGLHRGYFTSRDREVWPYGPSSPMGAHEFVVGSGIGMTRGRVDAADQVWQAGVKRAEAARAATVTRLIEADPRNRCTYFRVSGELCAHHHGAMTPGGGG